VQRILKSKGVWSVSDLDDRVVEAILGPELTRKLDDYIAREEVQNLQRKRWTRLEVIKGGVEVVIAHDARSWPGEEAPHHERKGRSCQHPRHFPGETRDRQHDARQRVRHH
jgi:hypothetical protein